MVLGAYLPSRAKPHRWLFRRRGNTSENRQTDDLGLFTSSHAVERDMLLNEKVRNVLNSGHLAHLVTLEPDGSPQVSVVWVGLDGDEIVAGHLMAWRKVVNIRRDRRVALSMETGAVGTNGLAEYLVVHGTARITEGGAPELLQRLAYVYLGADVKFPPMDNPPSGYITRISPTRVGGVGPWQT